MKTNKDYTIKEMRIGITDYSGIIVPKGTEVTHKTAMGIDTNYHFVCDFSWYAPELEGFARKMAIHDFIHYGIDIPKEFIEYDELTLEEAINNGFDSFVYPEDGYQSIKMLDEYKESEIDFTKKPMLCEKEPFHPAGLSSKEIAEILSDHIQDCHFSDTGDDTFEVLNILKDIDCTDLSERIQERLNTLNYRTQSNTALVKSF